MGDAPKKSGHALTSGQCTPRGGSKSMRADFGEGKVLSVQALKCKAQSGRQNDDGGVKGVGGSTRMASPDGSCDASDAPDQRGAVIAIALC